jgi:hypothetical protein
VANHSGARIGYDSVFHYNQRHGLDDAFIRQNGLIEVRWLRLIEVKANLIRAYQTQADPLFNGEDIPVVPEVFLVPQGLARSSKGGHT